jgi:hypothetical protein
MWDSLIWEDLIKERHQDFLCDAEKVRLALRSKKVSRLPTALKNLVAFLISVT